jgi:hypothetical protein
MLAVRSARARASHPFVKPTNLRFANGNRLLAPPLCSSCAPPVPPHPLDRAIRLPELQCRRRRPGGPARLHYAILLSSTAPPGQPLLPLLFSSPSFRLGRKHRGLHATRSGWCPTATNCHRSKIGRRCLRSNMRKRIAPCSNPPRRTCLAVSWLQPAAFFGTAPRLTELDHMSHVNN